MTQFPYLSDLAADYDAILCDVWGVIRDGSDLLPEALDALRQYRAQGGTVILVSNSPRRASSLENFLHQMGAGDDVWDGAVSSGEGTHALLKTRAPDPAFKLGPDTDDALYRDTGLDFARLEDAAFISCTGLFDWSQETPEDYVDLLTEAKLRRLDMICANPDIVVQFGDGLRYCAGALAEKYEALGGNVIMAGKPHPPIYDLAYREIERLRGEVVDKSRILAIGDGPVTDIKGAQAEGVDALFIAGGILAEQFGDAFDADKAAALLKEDGLDARHVAPKLVW